MDELQIYNQESKLADVQISRCANEASGATKLTRLDNS
jgi:hypothetical protein